MPFNWEMDQQNAAHTYNTTAPNGKREQIVDTDSNMDETLMHYTKRRKPDGRVSTIYVIYTCGHITVNSISNIINIY